MSRNGTQARNGTAAVCTWGVTAKASPPVTPPVTPGSPENQCPGGLIRGLYLV